MEATISDYHPGVHTLSNGDPGYPPEGGECESYTWEVEDLDEVLEALEITSEHVECWIRAVYKFTYHLPPIIARKIADTWEADIQTAAEEQDHDDHE